MVVRERYSSHDFADEKKGVRSSLPAAARTSQRDADRLPWRHDTRNHGAGGQPACDKGPHRRTAFSGPTSSPPNHLITADSNPGHPGTETIMSKGPNHSTKAAGLMKKRDDERSQLLVAIGIGRVQEISR